MKGVKELKARIKSVGNIRKVTSTMELVATARMKKLQERAVASRPYAESIRAMMARVAAHAPGDASPLLKRPTEITRECVVVIGGTKGLCGAFNSNVFRKAVNYVKLREAAGVTCEIYTMGRRSDVFFRKIKATVMGSYEGKLDNADYRSIAPVMRVIADDFVAGRVQAVTMIYSEFRSAVSFVPTNIQLLPVAAIPSAASTPEAQGQDYIMEPSARIILERLVPKALEMNLYNAVLESLASEFAARRVAMKNATDSATEMIGDLTREYNKARQAGITGELLEITAGAEALKG